MKQSNKRNLSAALLTLLALLVLAFAFQGSRGIYSPDEGYYVEISDSMVRTGDYLIPRLGSKPWLDKPPLSFWGVASGLYLLGHNEWGARAFHALCHVLTTLLVYSLGRSLWGKRYAIWAGVIYATMIMPFFAANIVTTDTPLTLATAAAYYCFWRSLKLDGWRAVLWNNLMFTALGLAFLTKGPAALIPAVAIFSFLLVRRQALSYLLKTWAPVGLTVFCLVGFGWYVYVARELPGALEFVWKNQVVDRTFSTELNRNSGPRGALIYLPVFLLGTLPWSAAWWPALWRGRKRIFHTSPWRWFSADPARLLLSTWIAIPLLLLSLASSKLAIYALPVFPALALATSRSMFFRPGRHTNPADSTGFSVARIGFLILWGSALIGLKLVAATYPYKNDMRALYASMEAHLPQDVTNEIVAVREHLEGLRFYGPQLVEYVSATRKPYPFFILPESLEEEIGEMGTSTDGHVFVCRREIDVHRMREILNRAGFPFEEFFLPLGYHMFVVKPSRKDGVVRLAVLGDFGKGPNRSRRLTISSAIRLVNEEKPLDGVVILSDTPSRSARGPENLASLVRTKVELPFAEMLEEGIPFYFALGGNGHQAALQAFELRNGSLEMKGKRYYSKVLGGGLIELFVLDSNALTNADLEQLAWLNESLAGSRSPWKIVALYHPIHLTTQSHATHSNLASLLEPVLVQGGVVLVFQGHDLHYERSNGVRGMKYVSPGSSGMVTQTGEHSNVPEDAFYYDKMQVFVLLECNVRDCHLAAFNGLGQVVDEATIEHPAKSPRFPTLSQR